MGRIKTKLIKRKARALFSLYGDKLTESYEDNKKVVSQFVDSPSKKLKKAIAGFATRLKKREEVL